MIKIILKKISSKNNKYIQTAIISRRLNAVAKDVDNDKEARIAIEKFCESFEKEILMEFDKAYEESDPRVMAVSFDYIGYI